MQKDTKKLIFDTFIEQLEKKVDKHNSVIERTYLLEEKMKETERRLEKIEDIT